MQQHPLLWSLFEPFNRQRLYLRQVCADGPGCSGQIGHTGNGGQYMHFNLTSANDGERFVCPKCTKSYAYKGNLNKHMDKMLKNIDRYPCETCERVFTGGVHVTNTMLRLMLESGDILFRYVTSLSTSPTTLKVHVLRFHPNKAAFLYSML